MSKVLIIDDNQKNVEILKDFCEAWGYETCCAYQGIQALDMVEVEKPDIILLDVMLPGMSGFEVAANLRNNENTRDIPIVMVSALTSPEDRANGFANGADNFLVKPISYKELKAVMAKLLKRREALLTREDEQAVMAKLLWVVKNYLITEPNRREYTEAKIATLKDILSRMNLNPIVLGRMLWVMRFQYCYEDALKEPTKLQDFNKLLEGLQISYWLQPILAYSCQNYAERDKELLATIKERRLEDVADYCYIVKRLHDIWIDCDEDVPRTLDVFRKEKQRYAYPEEFCYVYESGIEAEELKKLLDII